MIIYHGSDRKKMKLELMNICFDKPEEA